MDGVTIRVLPLPGHTMVAFFERQIKGVYAGHDLEDMAYLLNCITDIDEQILSVEKEVTIFLIVKLKEFNKDNAILTAICGSLYYNQADERMEIILQRIQNIIDSSK